MEKLRRAREKRGWSNYELSRESGVNSQVIENLEGGSWQTRPSRPHGASIKTALKLIETLWPDLQLKDFVPETSLSATPKSKRADEKLSRPPAA